MIHMQNKNNSRFFILFYSCEKLILKYINKKYNSNFIIHFCKFDVLQRNVNDNVVCRYKQINKKYKN